MHTKNMSMQQTLLALQIVIVATRWLTGYTYSQQSSIWDWQCLSVKMMVEKLYLAREQIGDNATSSKYLLTPTYQSATPPRHVSMHRLPTWSVLSSARSLMALPAKPENSLAFHKELPTHSSTLPSPRKYFLWWRWPTSCLWALPLVSETPSSCTLE